MNREFIFYGIEMLSINLSALRALPKEEEKELTAEHIQAIEKFIPVFGSLFGLAVLLFHIWDHLIFPESAREALIVRVSLVAIGASLALSGKIR